MSQKIKKTDAEWQAQLTPEQYRICRQKGTEHAFTGEYWDCHQLGIYHCVCCGAELFNANDKFDSGSGWPSFTRSVSEESIEEFADNSHSMHRVEATCQQCGAHLGHVFPDGPKPTGLRYCINSAALKFEKK